MEPLMTNSIVFLFVLYQNKDAKKFTLAPKKCLKVIDPKRFIFKLQIQNEVQSSEYFSE